MTPGPAPVHPDVTGAAVEPLPHHRAPAFKPRFAAVQAGLRSVFRCQEAPAVLACSGTGAVEAALVNLFAAGDRLVVLASGKFGERWGLIGEAFGLRVKSITLKPGQTFSADDAAEAIASHRPVNGFVLTASETSTAACYDVRAIAEAARRVEPEIAVVVDAITATGAFPVHTDEWELDAVCGGSQKAFMMPPGLGFVACSARGWERVREDRTKPRFYFDLRKYADANAKDQTPFTPATSLLLELEAALGVIDAAGGIEALEANAQHLAGATRAAARALGLGLLSPDNPSPAVTAILAHEQGRAPEIVAAMRDRFGIAIAGGQGELKPDIFRIGHLGYIDEVDLMGTLAALERVLRSLGHDVASGTAVAGAAAWLEANG